MDHLESVGRYETVRLLGRGGMGEVYLARDPLIDRLVAIKLIAGGFDAAARERFTREARAAGRLQHANIATIFDVGDHRGRPFIAMEYVRGETLAALIRQAPPIATSAMLRLIEDASAGLAFAHNAGIVHLDVKPENLIRADDGRLKVLDFGIARVVEADETRTQHVMGTLRYMSPEQLTGGPIDRRSDVFALGCVLYEVIARRPAFGGTMTDIMSRVTGAGVVPLPQLAPDVHPTLVRIVSRAMAPDRADRYDNLETLRRELAMVRREIETAGSYTTSATSERVTIPGPAKAVGARARPLTWLVLGALIAAFATGIWLLPEEANQPSAGTAQTVEAPISNVEKPETPAPSPVVQPNAPKPTETAGRQSQLPLPPRTQSTTTSAPVFVPPPAVLRSTEADAQQPPKEPPSQAPPPPPAEMRTKDASGPAAEVASPSPPKTAPDVPAAEDAVRAVLRAYEAAYAQRDVAALRTIYPNLPTAQAEAIGRTFAGANSYRVEINVLDLRVNGSTANATCAVTHALVPKIGNASRNTLQMTFELQRTGDTWLIERAEGAAKPGGR